VILFYTCTILSGINCLPCFQNSLEWKTWSNDSVRFSTYYSSSLFSIVTRKNAVGFHLVTVYTNIVISFFLSFFYFLPSPPPPPPTSKRAVKTRITVLHFTLRNTTPKRTLISRCQFLSWFVRKSNCTDVDTRCVLKNETKACTLYCSIVHLTVQ
jgi:hypothetical protein